MSSFVTITPGRRGSRGIPFGPFFSLVARLWRSKSDTTFPIVCFRAAAMDRAAARTSSSRSNVVLMPQSSNITHQMSTRLGGEEWHANLGLRSSLSHFPIASRMRSSARTQRKAGETQIPKLGNLTRARRRARAAGLLPPKEGMTPAIILFHHYERPDIKNSRARARAVNFGISAKNFSEFALQAATSSFYSSNSIV